MESPSIFVLTMARSSSQRRYNCWAHQSRDQADPDLSRLTLGERIQREVQRHASPRGAQRRMVRNHQTGTERHRHMAQAIQSRPPASVPEHDGHPYQKPLQKVAQNLGARHDRLVRTLLSSFTKRVFTTPVPYTGHAAKKHKPSFRDRFGLFSEKRRQNGAA